jgi:hypothetical protein
MTEIQSTEDDLFELLPVSLQQAVARGDVDLDELLDRVTRPGAEICPHCGVNEIDPNTQAGRRGICVPCVRRRFTDAANERLANLEALRENNAAKTAVKRARIEIGAELGINLNPRGGKHKGGRHSNRPSSVSVIGAMQPERAAEAPQEAWGPEREPSIGRSEPSPNSTHPWRTR